MEKKYNEIFISVDTETAGPIPGEFSLLSLGACVIGNTNKKFYTEIKPINLNFVKKSLEVSGLSIEKLLVKGEPPKTAMERFEKWIIEASGDKRPVFVAFNATFDWMFVHWYFIKFLKRDPFGISGLDIKAYFMGLKKTSWRETAKKHVKRQFPSKQAHTHNARDDAIEQAEIFEKMLKS